MASMLLKETKVWRVDSEDEAVETITDFKDNANKGGYTVTKSGYKIKTKKSKGDIIDLWAEVEVTFAYEV